MNDRHLITVDLQNALCNFLDRDRGNSAILCRKLGVNKSTLSRIRNGKTKTVGGDLWRGVE